MSAPARGVARRLGRLPGVRAALVVDAATGTPVASEVLAGVPEDALAALAASLLSRTSDAADAAGIGRARVVQLESAGGMLLVAAAGALVVVVATEAGAGVGMARSHALHAARELSA